MTGYSLDPSPEEMRAMGQAAVDYVIDFIHGLSEAPARNVDGAQVVAVAARDRARAPNSWRGSGSSLRTRPCIRRSRSATTCASANV